MNPTRVRWGVMLILIGLVFLLINVGQLSWWIWVDLLRLWPVLLIAIGFEIIVKRSKMQIFGYVSTLIILAAFGWVIYDNGGFGGDGYGSFPSSRDDANIGYNNETSARIKVKFSDGRIYFNSSDSYLMQTVAENSDRGFSLESNCQAGNCDLELVPATKHLPRFIHVGSSENHWKCYVHRNVGGRYNLDIDNSDLRFFGQELSVDTMLIDADHSDLVIKLGKAQTRAYIELTGRNTDLDISLPDSAGVRFEGIMPTETEIAAFNLTDRGGYYANDAYATALNTFTVKSDLSSGRVRVSSY